MLVLAAVVVVVVVFVAADCGLAAAVDVVGCALVLLSFSSIAYADNTRSLAKGSLPLPEKLALVTRVCCCVCPCVVGVVCVCVGIAGAGLEGARRGLDFGDPEGVCARVCDCA